MPKTYIPKPTTGLYRLPPRASLGHEQKQEVAHQGGGMPLAGLRTSRQNFVLKSLSLVFQLRCFPLRAPIPRWCPSKYLHGPGILAVFECQWQVSHKEEGKGVPGLLCIRGHTQDALV
eukprot:1156597-Pelagomonas_calceolata.AAC.3